MIGPSLRDSTATNFTRPTSFIENERNCVSIEKESSLRRSIEHRHFYEGNSIDCPTGQREISKISSFFLDRVSIVRNFLSRKKKKTNHLFGFWNKVKNIYPRYTNRTRLLLLLSCYLSFLNNFLSHDWWIDIAKTLFHNISVYFRNFL